MTDEVRAVDKLRIAKAYRIAWADGVEPTNVWGIDCPCADIQIKSKKDTIS